VVDIVKSTLDACSAELADDVMHRGIALTGGGALLRGLDKRLREETRMPIQLADNPLESVALGAGKCVKDFDALRHWYRRCAGSRLREGSRTRARSDRLAPSCKWPPAPLPPAAQLRSGHLAAHRTGRSASA